MLLHTLTVLQHGSDLLLQLGPAGVSPPQQAAGGLLLHCQGGRAHQGVAPAAGARLLPLLGFFRTTLEQPGQLLQKRGTLSCQAPASSEPVLQRVLGGQVTAPILSVALEVGLHALEAGS